jgi:vancomycin resistance protein VanJ
VVSLQEQSFEGELLNLLPEQWKAWSNGEIVLVTRFRVLDQKVLPRERSTGPGAANSRQTVAIDFRLDTPGGPIDFVAVHLYTPRKGLEAVKETLWNGIEGMYTNLDKRSRESQAASRWIAGLAGPVIVAGDLNLPPESAIFRRDWARYTDAFSESGSGYGYTFGYTHSGRWYGIRIDHILAGEGWKVQNALVGPHVDSDHRPVIAELVRSREASGQEAAGSGQP